LHQLKKYAPVEEICFETQLFPLTNFSHRYDHSIFTVFRSGGLTACGSDCHMAPLGPAASNPLILQFVSQ
jgi:hypothetical protein